jgi:hypothetical protein
MHVVVKDRLAARKQQRYLFAPVCSCVLGNDGPTFLNVELARLGSVQESLRASPNNSFIRDYAFECLGKTLTESCYILPRTEKTEQNRNRTEQKQDRTEKTSMVIGVKELHIDPQEGCMVVKDNSHMIGERLNKR